MISPVGGRHCYDTASSTWEAVRKRRVVLNAKMRPHKSHPSFTPPCHLYRKCLDRTQLWQLFSNLECWLSCLQAWPCTYQYSLNLLGLLSPPALILHDLKSCALSWVRMLRNLGFQPHPHLYSLWCLWCCWDTASGGVNWSPSRGEGLTHTLETLSLLKL